MPIPTVRVEHDGFTSGFKTINEEDYDPDEHALYEDNSGSDDEEPEVTYDLAGNGFWTVYEDGEEVDSGRGKENLDIALAELGESRETATRLDR